MVKWKLLIAVVLYIILGVIAYFNFGFHHLMFDKWAGKSKPNESAWKKLEENIKKAHTGDPHESQDTFSDQEVNH